MKNWPEEVPILEPKDCRKKYALRYWLEYTFGTEESKIRDDVIIALYREIIKETDARQGVWYFHGPPTISAEIWNQTMVGELKYTEIKNV